LKNKICPVCGSIKSITLKDYKPEVCYYNKKSFGKSIKIWECENCGHRVERNKNSFDKSYNKEFIKLRNEVTKEMVRDIMKFYVSECGRYSEIERILYLEPNYFSDIVNNKRKIQPEDATLIAIIYNFPFVIKCAAHDFSVNKSIEYIKEFISNLEKSMEINAKNRVNEMCPVKEEIPISKKDI
jgi:hypothetical protein